MPPRSEYRPVVSVWYEDVGSPGGPPPEDPSLLLLVDPLSDVLCRLPLRVPSSRLLLKRFDEEVCAAELSAAEGELEVLEEE